MSDAHVWQPLAEAVERFPGLRVLVVGDVMLDVYDFCYTAHSKAIDSEKKGKRAYSVMDSPLALGGAGNVAANLRSLGARAMLAGVTGDDGGHFEIRALTERQGMEHLLLRDAGRPTTTKSRLYIDDQYVLRRDHESSAPVAREIALTLLAEVRQRLDDADALVLSDYAKGLFHRDTARDLVRAAGEHGVPVVVDFKPGNRRLFEQGDLLVPNEGEADALAPGFRGLDGEALERAARDLQASLQCRRLVVTLGQRGLCGIDAAGDYFRIPGNRVEEIDAVGCGDTVRAALALGLAAGLRLQQAARLANDAAAVIVQKPSTALVTPGELLEFWRRQAAAS